MKSLASEAEAKQKEVEIGIVFSVLWSTQYSLVRKHSLRGKTDQSECHFETVLVNCSEKRLRRMECQNGGKFESFHAFRRQNLLELKE